MSARPRIPFRAVNRRGEPGYNPSLQRHHLLPLQLLRARSLQALFVDLHIEQRSFDDFRRNGMLLPASESSALLLGLPLHRGPHRAYNEMVLDRIGEIESRWRRYRARAPLAARCWAGARCYAIQASLRTELARPSRHRGSPYALNRRDPVFRQVDYSGLDTMADMLWGATAPGELS